MATNSTLTQIKNKNKSIAGLLFKNKTNLALLIGVELTLIVLFLYFLFLPSYQILPSPHDHFYFSYTDGGNGGNSVVDVFEVQDSLLRLNYTLKEGFLSPYVGFTIGSEQDSIIDVKRFNKIDLDINADGENGIAISLFTDAIKLDNTDDNSPFLYDLQLLPGRHKYTILLNQLRVPDWWYSQNHLSMATPIAPDFNSVRHINIGVIYPSELEKAHEILFHSISFGRDNKKLGVILGALLVFFPFLLFASVIVKLKLAKTANKLTVTYKPVEVEDAKSEQADFMSFINENFTDSELSLEHIATHFAVSQRKITHYIQEQYSCNFKTYLNNIRITEAKRLLQSSELNIGEIAFKVGFNNQSHFNRVFKNTTNTSPGAFKSKNKG